MKNAPNLFSSAMYTVLTEVCEYNLSSVEKNASVIAVSYITEKKKHLSMIVQIIYLSCTTYFNCL